MDCFGISGANTTLTQCIIKWCPLFKSRNTGGGGLSLTVNRQLSTDNYFHRSEKQCKTQKLFYLSPTGSEIGQ